MRSPDAAKKVSFEGAPSVCTQSTVRCVRSRMDKCRRRGRSRRCRGRSRRRRRGAYQTIARARARTRNSRQAVQTPLLEQGDQKRTHGQPSLPCKHPSRTERATRASKQGYQKKVFPTQVPRTALSTTVYICMGPPRSCC